MPDEMAHKAAIRATKRQAAPHSVLPRKPIKPVYGQLLCQTIQNPLSGGNSPY
jgi:hypothetical protein